MIPCSSAKVRALLTLWQEDCTTTSCTAPPAVWDALSRCQSVALAALKPPAQQLPQRTTEERRARLDEYVKALPWSPTNCPKGMGVGPGELGPHSPCGW